MEDYLKERKKVLTAEITEAAKQEQHGQQLIIQAQAKRRTAEGALGEVLKMEKEMNAPPEDS